MGEWDVVEETSSEGWGVVETSKEEESSPFMETTKELGKLAKDPMGVIAGAIEFESAIPGFITGLAGASQNVIRGFLGGGNDIEDLYNLASEGFQREAEKLPPVHFEGHPQSHLVGEVSMAPAIAIMKGGHALADKVEDPNIRGGIRFASDILGFAAQGKIMHGSKPRMGQRKAPKQPKKITPESEFIREKFDKEFLDQEQVVPIETEVKAQFETIEPVKFKKPEPFRVVKEESIKIEPQVFYRNPYTKGEIIDISPKALKPEGFEGATDRAMRLAAPLSQKDIPRLTSKKAEISKQIRQLLDEGKGGGEEMRALMGEAQTLQEMADALGGRIHFKKGLEKARKKLAEQKKPKIKEVELTPEETFVLDAEGIEGLKEATEQRQKSNEAVETGKPVDGRALIKERAEKLKQQEKKLSPEEQQRLDDEAFLAEAGEEANRPRQKTDEELLDEQFLGEERAEDFVGRDRESRTGRQFEDDVPLDRIITDDGITLYGGLPLHKFAELYTKYIGEPIWDNLIMTKIPKVIERIPKIGKPILRATLYDYRGDLPNTPLYMDSVANMRRHQQIGKEYGLDLGNRLNELPERSQRVVGDRIRGLDVEMTKAEASLAIEARNSLDALGKQAVDVGLLSERVFFENVGRYMPRLYTSKEYNANIQKFGMFKPTRLEMSRFMKRKDIPKKLRKEMGEILTPGYPVAKGIIQLTHDIEMASHFNYIAKNPDWAKTKVPVIDPATGKPTIKKTVKFDPRTGEKTVRSGPQMDFEGEIPTDWVQLPNEKKLGNLSEAYVHPEIAADLNLAIKISTKGERTWKRALGAWKFGKVILSPKTHARNLMSNSFLGHLGGMPLWKQPVTLFKSAKEMRSKGDYWKLAKEEGLLDTTWTEGELFQLFDDTTRIMKNTQAETMPWAMGKVGQVWSKAKLGADKAAKLYSAEEQWFKLAKFIDNIESRNMSSKEAAVDAQKWLFDYTKLTKAQELYRSKWYGAPFATFTIKSMPRMAETLVKTPWRFAVPAAMIYALEESARRKFGDSKETSEQKKKLRPDWMQGNFAGIPNFPRVPVEDDSGREYYINLSYIVPWGDLGEGGAVGPIPGGLMPLSQPFTKEIWQQLAGSKGWGDSGGYDTFWKEPIVKDTDVAGLPLSERRIQATKKRMRHLYNTLVPTLAIDIEKGIDAIGGNPDFRGRERPGAVVAADVFGGFKMYPVDYAERMLQEAGQLNPQTSHVARQIMNEIRSFAAKRNYANEKGQHNKAKKLDKKIADKVRQLQGLGAELKEKGETFKKIQENKK